MNIHIIALEYRGMKIKGQGATLLGELWKHEGQVVGYEQLAEALTRTEVDQVSGGDLSLLRVCISRLRAQGVQGIQTIDGVGYLWDPNILTEPCHTCKGAGTIRRRA